MPVRIPWNDDFSDYIRLDHPEGFGTGDGNLDSLGTIIGDLMPYVFSISGIVLLFMIIAAGYQLLTSAGNPEGMEKGKKRLTAALTGFILIFAAFWILQLVEVFIGFDTIAPV